MSEPQWQKQGAALSHKNPCKEFGLTKDEVIAAMKAGKLQYLINYAHGKAYYKLLPLEVEQLALERHLRCNVFQIHWRINQFAVSAEPASASARCVPSSHDLAPRPS